MTWTHFWAGEAEGWIPFPNALDERPVECFRGLVETCPEYSGQMLQFTVVGAEWSLVLQDDGRMAGTEEELNQWRIGDRTWLVTVGPFPLMASSLEPPS